MCRGLLPAGQQSSLLNCVTSSMWDGLRLCESGAAQLRLTDPGCDVLGFGAVRLDLFCEDPHINLSEDPRYALMGIDFGTITRTASHMCIIDTI